MRRMRLCLFVLMLAGTAVSAQISSEKPPASLPVSPFAWLVGGVWTASAANLNSGVQRIETRYQWSETKNFVRFNTHFVTDKGIARAYDGNFFWSPSHKTIEVWYMDGNNEIVEGPVRVDGDVLTITFRTTNGEGQMADYRIDVTRMSHDRYHWSLKEKHGEAWADVLALEYVRSAGS